MNKGKRLPGTEKWLMVMSVVLLTCTNNPVDSREKCLDQSSDDVLLPLTVGNYWNYKIKHYWEDSVTYSVSKKHVMEFEGEVFDAYEWNREDSDIRWLFTNKDDGLYLVGGYSDHDIMVHPVLEYKYPAEKDESWQVPRMVYNLYENRFYFKDTITVTCVDNNKMVSTPAGSFNTHVYMYKLRIAEDVLGYDYFLRYYAPSHGLVYSEVKSSPGGTNVRASMSLIDYCIKP